MPAVADPLEMFRTEAGQWRDDPVRFARRVLAVEHLTAQSIEILEALRDHKRVAVAACHASAKTFTASVAAWWWALSNYPSKVVTTAPTDRQVRALLWAEIRQRFSAAKMEQHGLGRMLLTQWEMPDEADWFMTGFATAPDKVEEGAIKFQGFHSPHLLLVFDEASGIPRGIWDAAEGIMTGADDRWLAIGNPIDSTGEFAKAYRDPDWHSIRISALDTPNLQAGEVIYPYLVTPDWCDHMRRKYGEGSAVYKSKVLGLFPDTSTDTLISLADVQLALARPEIVDEVAPRSMGVDVARFGDDMTVFYILEGGRILKVEERAGQNLMETAGMVIRLATDYGIPKGDAWRIAIDDTGLGGGVTDRLHEQGWNVGAENFGTKPRSDEGMKNRRTELWWNLREWIREDATLDGLPDQLAEELQGDLTTPKYQQASNGKIELESKKEIKRRLGHSPDHGDALALALAWRTIGPAISVSSEEAATDSRRWGVSGFRRSGR